MYLIIYLCLFISYSNNNNTDSHLHKLTFQATQHMQIGSVYFLLT